MSSSSSYPRQNDEEDDECAYYQHHDVVVCGVEAAASPPSWTFVDTTHIINSTHTNNYNQRLLSRDNSIHVTDEVFNSISHLSAAMLSFLGMVLLIAQSGGDPWKIVSFSVYGSSLLFLFSCSTLHHAITGTAETEKKLRMLDYLAIFPLIAGTYTPLCLVFFHKSVIGWSFLGVAWFLAFCGMILTAQFGPERIPKWLSMTMYITLGWIGAFLSIWLLPIIGISGLIVFFLGGVAFTVGGVVYTSEQPNPIPGKFGFHEIWHIAVILGTGFHFAVMYVYVLPWRYRT